MYESYRETLVALQGTSELEPVLRCFEMSLLAELGYAINLEHDCETDLPIVAESVYRFIPGLGFLQASLISAGAASGPDEFRGAVLSRCGKWNLPMIKRCWRRNDCFDLLYQPTSATNRCTAEGCLPFRPSVALAKEAIEVQFGF